MRLFPSFDPPAGPPRAPRDTARWPALALLLLSVVACSEGPLGPARESLQANRDLWDRRGPASYSYVYEVNCFCASPALRPVRITVETGEVVGAVREETGDEVEGQFPTVEDLFERIQDAVDREAHEISAGYDPELGYPTAVFIDYERRVIDEEFGFLASDLRAADAP